MNTMQLEGNWQKMKGAAREQWGKLTDDDIERIKAFQVWYLKTKKRDGCDDVDVFEFDLVDMNDMINFPSDNPDDSFDSRSMLDEILDKLRNEEVEKKSLA